MFKVILIITNQVQLNTRCLPDAQPSLLIRTGRLGQRGCAREAALLLYVNLSLVWVECHLVQKGCAYVTAPERWLSCPKVVFCSIERHLALFEGLTIQK